MRNAATLLIDDNEEFSRSVISLFEGEGIRLDWAHEWDEGVGLFRVVLHELVIADYNLPGSPNGLKLLAKLKPLRPSTVFILISGALTSKAEALVKRTPLVDEYLTKTSELPDLLLTRARAAEERAPQSSNWQEAAVAHVKNQSVYETVIDEVDTILKGQIQP